jgi:thymidylate kinase
MLITLYGINNIGKSTQALRLVERLRAAGWDAVYCKYPVYEMEPTGRYLNEFLRSGGAQTISEEELQMWFTLNRYQFQPTLQKWLAEGKIVVAEDYTGTGIAWGTVKGAKTEWLETLNEGLVKEDLALLLDGDRFTKAQEEGHLHEANEAFMKRARQIHLELGEKYGWIHVPVEPGIEKTELLIWEEVQSRIGSPTTHGTNP